MRRIILALVEDKPGVLNRIASMFRRRGFNIYSLAVGHSEVPDMSRMVIVVDNAPPNAVDQVTKQLDKIIEVVKVDDITELPIVTRETAMIKVRASPSTRGQIIEVLDLFKGVEVADVSPNSIIIEMTGTTDVVESLLALLKDYGIIEIMRTGQLAMVRDSQLPD